MVNARSRVCAIPWTQVETSIRLRFPGLHYNRARTEPTVSIASRSMDKVFSFCGRAVMRKVLAACVVVCLFGCGAKNQAAADTASAEPNKPPATVEEAAKVIDLSTFPLMEGAKSSESRHVANLSYVAPGDPKKALEFHRKTFSAQGWKELPNSTVTDDSASAMFARDGFVVSLSVIPYEKTGVSVRLQNLGNIKPGQLPAPPGAKAVYVGEPTAMYDTQAAVPATADAIRKLFVAQGWVPYGTAGDTDNFKRARSSPRRLSHPHRPKAGRP